MEWLKFKEQCKENQRLQTLLDLCEGNEIQAFENGKYTNNIREVVLELHKLHIPIRAIAPSIKLIIQKLTNDTVSRLPEYGTIHKITYEGRCLALLEAGRAMLRDKESRGPASVLKNDGTTKLKRRYDTAIVGTSEWQKSIGLKLFAAENADTLLQASEESLNEVAEIVASVENREKEEIFSDILCNFTATMSDRAGVMKSFNKKLREWRAHIVNDRYLAVAKKEKALSTFVNHHCFLHIIINLGDDACKNGLGNLDKCFVNIEALGDLSLKGSSTTYTAIYAAA